MNEQEFVKLKADCEVYKDRIHKLEQLTAEQEKRIQELEKNTSKTDFQYDQIMKILDKLTNETIPKLTEEVQTIKNKPAERYNSMVTIAISTIITTLVGGIIGYFIKVFQK